MSEVVYYVLSKAQGLNHCRFSDVCGLCISLNGCTGVFIFTDKSVKIYYGTAVDSLKEIDTQKTSVYKNKQGLSLSVRVMFVFIYTLLDCFGQKKGNLKKRKVYMR